MASLLEHQYGKGAIKINPVRRYIRRKKKLGKSSVPFDWATGYDSVDKIGGITIKNQQQSGSCGGQAASYFAEIVRRLNNLAADPISAKSIYAPIHYDGGGTTVVDIEKQLTNCGANTEASVPSQLNGTCTEGFMEDLSYQTPDLTKDALTRIFGQAIPVALDIESVAQAIRDYGAVIIELGGKNNGTWLSANPQPPAGKPDWYHFMCFMGASVTSYKALHALQSWGADVGDGGKQYFGQGWFDSGAIIDCFTFQCLVPAQKHIFTTDIKYGDTSPEVTELQKKLIMLGYLNVGIFGNVPMGHYGPLTRAAVFAFQKKNISTIAAWLDMGYTVGPRTRAALNSI